MLSVQVARRLEVKMKFLIVEDEVALSKMLRATLSSLAETDISNSGEDAIEKLSENFYDLILLDLMLPGMSGDEVLKKVRKDCTTPIIILSAISDVDKKVACLNLGADDYIEKPFSREELLARVQAALRRSNSNFDANTYTFKNMVVNFNNKMLLIDDERIDLNRKTYEILELLVRNKELIMTKQQIFERIWGYCSDTIPTVIEINIFRLRKILGEYDLQKHLKTIKSTGYIWTEKV